MNLTVDLSYLNELCDNDSSFIIEILETFLEESPKDLQQINDYIIQNDIVNTGKLIHKTKASLKLLGVTELLGFAVKAEQLAKIDPSNTRVLKLGQEYCTHVNQLTLNVNDKLQEVRKGG